MENQFNQIKKSKELQLSDVHIQDHFWDANLSLVKQVVIPYQWDVLNDKVPEAAPSHAIKNFRIAAGLETGEFYGFFFQDTDLAKWLEAVAYSLQTQKNPELEKTADEAIELVAKAQCADGYLNTYFQISEPDKRFTDLEECHELYTAGHMIEAGVAYFQSTGKRTLLDVVCRLADCIDAAFGPEEGKLHGYDGHQEIELALVRLYQVTGERRYLALSRYFLETRGTEPYFFEEEWERRNHISAWSKKEGPSPRNDAAYTQSHKPIKEQTEAVGHAVREVYMLIGLADMAGESGDVEMLDTCKVLWNNIVKKQMYITGGIGSTGAGEAFTFDYDLPNDTIYSETCASIGLVILAQRLLQIENKSCYSDVIEKALFNVIMASMSKDGKHYFYVNPLEVWPKASKLSPIKGHVKPVRQKWFGCACCPPNLARLLSSLGKYIYTKNEDTIFVHQYIGNKTTVKTAGTDIGLELKTEYPWNGTINLKLNPQEEKEYTVALRIPGWCRKAILKVDEEAIEIKDYLKDGYVYLKRTWKKNSSITLQLELQVERMQANPSVRADIGKVVLQRGPVVYCLEEADNGENLPALVLLKESGFEVKFEEDLLGGVNTITAQGKRIPQESWTEELYRPFTEEGTDTVIKAVPYYSWGNREAGEMLVWIRN